MKAFVIGGGGFIGSNLVTALAREGFELIVGHRRRSSASSPGPESARFVKIDLEDTDAIGRLLDAERPDVVVHLASALIPASSAAEYFEERRSVLDPSLRLMLGLADRGIKLVYFSSGGTVYGRTAEKSLSEASPCRPISFYGQFKLEMESLIRFVHRTSGLPYLIIRPSNPFGAPQSLQGRQGLIAAILGCMLDGRPLQIWGDGGVVRDYIYVDDLCAAVGHLLRRGIVNDTVNIGSGVGHTVIEAVRTVEHVVSRKLAIDFRDARPVDVPRVVLDVSKLAMLGAPPARPLIDGVRAYVAALGDPHA